MNIDSIYPELFEYFGKISDIPRASYKEQEIARYLCDFAEQRGLEYYCDDANNVLINLPATEGCESVDAVLLQGHTDMVCEKRQGISHDFDTQGIKIYRDGDMLRAHGTTLGADDGVAVASMLTITCLWSALSILIIFLA